MDPITIIGLLASLGNLIEGANSVIKIIRSIKDGDKDLRELTANVITFTEALKGFDRVLRNRQTLHHISPSVIQSALDDGYQTIKDLDTRLQQFSKIEVSPVRRMKWIQHKPALKKLHERLKDQNATLQTFLTLTHVETYLAVVSQHPQIKLMCSPPDEDSHEPDVVVEEQEVEIRISGQQEADPVTDKRQASDNTALNVPQYGRGLSVRRMSTNSVITVESSTSSLTTQSTVSSTTSFGSSTSSLRPSEDFYNVSRPGSSTQVIQEQTLVVRRACRYDCFCACHQKDKAESQKLSSRKSTKVPCTEPTCQSAIESEKKAAAQSASFKKVLSQVLSSKSIKIRYDLNTYRMVPEGSNAFRYVKHGNLEKLKASIVSGEATIWDTAPDGWSLLHTAAYNRQLPIVKYLLESGADTKNGDVGSRRPADLAVLKSLGQDATQIEQDILEVFSKKDDCISDFEFTPIHVAVLGIYDATDRERPSLEALIQLVDDANNAPGGTDWAKWKLRYRDRSPLFGAILEYFRAAAFETIKGKKIIINLIDRKDKINCWTPLHWAASAGRVDKIKILMDHGADPFLLSNLDANILHAAAESKIDHGLAGVLDIWRRYPEQLNINQANRWGETPLHVSAWCSAACVKLLLEAGADPDAQQEDNQVPLHCAGLSGRGPDRQKIVSLLCGAQSRKHINTQDVDGRPPIFDFIDDTECLEILVSHGAQLDLCDYSGKNIFHHACIQDESDALRTLLRLDNDSADVTAKDHDGNTPLIEALCHSSLDCTLALLELEDVGDIVGKDGWAAVHYAAKIGDAYVLERILTHRSFMKGMRTMDGKTVEIVAMEAGTWSGEVKALVRRYNSLN